MDILDGALLPTDILSGLGNTWTRLVIAVLAKALLLGRDLSYQLHSNWCRSSSIWVLVPVWRSWSLLRLVLPEDFTWTTLVLLEHWRVLGGLNLRSTSWLISGGAPLILENSLVIDHHHHRTIIWENDATVLVLRWSIVAEITVPLLLLLVHLHHLHDRVLHLNLLTSTESRRFSAFLVCES